MCYVQTKQILLDLFSAIFVQLVKSRKTISEGHVARTGDRKSAYRALVGNPEGKSHLEDPDVVGGINITVDINEIGWGLGRN
jgi:hypothetical protein